MNDSQFAASISALSAAPGRASLLLKAAWHAMEYQEFRDITQDEISRVLGVSPGTFVNWTTRTAVLNQLEAALRLLERLPESARSDLLNRVLRKHPALNSPELAHEETQVSRLRMLTQERSGLTFIQGGSDSTRTFIFSAIGHSVHQNEPNRGVVSGLDVHRPDWFVPVMGIAYLTRWSDTASLKQAVDLAWPKQKPLPWLLLNGVWSLLSAERHRQLVAWAHNHHIVVADDLVYPEENFGPGSRGPEISVRLLKVSAIEHGRIRVHFQNGKV